MASSRPRTFVPGAFLLAAVIASLTLVADAGAHVRPPFVRQLSAPLERAHTFTLTRPATHLAVYWRGRPSARVSVALSRNGRRFAAPRRVPLDDLGRKTPGHETYSAVILARGATAARIYSDRPLRRVSLLVITDRGGLPRARTVARAASALQPQVIPRVDWGADESLRFDSSGKEIWPPAFYPVQKLIVHHTATQNNDPNPAATIRSIYYYHAVTLGWGDIGYNFLIDEAGRIYEGRHTSDYPSGSSPTEENSQGYGVTAAHAQGYNSGTVGIALLGTLTNQDATPAARSALEKLLAWESDHHGIDPQSSSLYVNPVSGTQATFPNIAGHRDVAATECPGGVFYATLPTIRSDVAALIAGTPPAPMVPAVTTGGASNVTGTGATISGTVNPEGQQTYYYFQWGTSTAYGGASASGSAGTGSASVSVSASLSGLQRRTTYHYRLVATNASGTSYGADRAFKTSRR